MLINYDNAYSMSVGVWARPCNIYMTHDHAIFIFLPQDIQRAFMVIKHDTNYKMWVWLSQYPINYNTYTLGDGVQGYITAKV